MTTFTFLKAKYDGQEDSDSIFVINNDRIENLNLADTYGKYGQLIGNEDAGDYHFNNSTSDAIRDCNTALKNAGLINNTDEIVWYFDNAAFVEDVYGENENCDKEAIEAFAKQWRLENESSEEVKGFNYWDGNNYKSVIVECSNMDDAITHEIITDPEEIALYTETISNMQFEKEQFGKKIYESGDFTITESAFASSWETYRID